MSLRSFTALCGFIALAVGVAVLCGWALDIEFLKSPLPGSASFKPNAAIGIAAAGAALMLALYADTPRRRAVVAMLALFVGALAGATLVEYAFHITLGIDTLLFAAPSAPIGAVASFTTLRPSFAAALELALVSLALLSLLSSSRLARLMLWLASLLGILIASFALMSYAYGRDTLYAVGPFSSVAVPASATFLLLFAALLLRSCQDSLRLPLISLVLLVLAPLTAVMVYFAHAERQNALAANRERAEALARLLSVEFGEIFGQADALLQHVVRVDDPTRGLDQCRRDLQSLASLYPWINLMRMSDRAGNTTCASKTQLAVNNIADRKFFLDAIRQRRFVVSEVFQARFTKELVMVAGRPLIRDNEVAGLASLGMDLWIFSEIVQRAGADASTTVTVLDQGGRVVAQDAGGPSLLGEDLVESPIVQQSLMDGTGTSDAVDWYGHERLFAFHAVPDTPVVVLVGLDKAALLQSIDQTLQGRMYLIVLIMGMAALASLIGGEVLIFRPLRKLAQTAGRIEQGDLTARPDITGRAEVGALGRAFATMADAVADRERQLNEALARHAAVFESAIDGIITLNESGSIESVNPAAERLFGHPAASLVRRGIATVLSDPKAPDAAPFGDLKGTVSGLGRVREMRGLRADGSRFPADVALSEMTLGAHRLMVAVVRDASERKRVDRLKSEFVSTVSHELRTPLTSIAGSLGLLVGGAAGLIPDGAKRLMTIAHQNSQRLIRLINDILDLEKIESGKLTFTRKPLDLGTLAEDAVEANQGFAQTRDVRLALDVVEHDDITVLGDRDRLMQVVTNLLSNAIKFSPAGGEVRVSVRQHDCSARLSVADQGPGIPLEFRSRIFGKFAQADSSDTRQKGGTGLGLAIAKEIAERHGGNVSFESELGHGTVFHLDLPSAAPILIGNEQEMAADVLLVEDDADTATVLRQMLSASGLSVAVASTAAQAEALTSMVRFQVILVDLGLPDRDGISLIRVLREQERTRRTPIIVVTAQPRGDAEGAAAAALEVLDWIEKPVEPARLKAALELAVGAAGFARILHVDDDPDVRQIVARSLATAGTTHSVSTRAEAERAVAAFDYDVVILDMNLTDGSGSELLPKLKTSTGASIPVVVFSAHDADPDLARKVASVLTKTHNSLEQLGQIVARLCRSARARDQEQPDQAKSDQARLKVS
jgi:PAS domain S-box-containing protein